MRITKRQLRRIIKEEKSKILAEQKVRRLVRRKLTEQSRDTINTEEELMDVITDREVSIEGGQEIRIAGEKYWMSRGGRAAVVYDIADVLQDMLADANGDFGAVLEKMESVAKRVTFDGGTERKLGITGRDIDKYRTGRPPM